MTKALTGLYLATTTADELRARAAQAGCSISDLGDLYIRRGLETTSVEALRKWAASRQTERTKQRSAMTKNERAVLEAIDALAAESEGAWIFPATAIAAAAGLRQIDGYSALVALKRRETVVQHRAEIQVANRFGRPVQSLWSVKGSGTRTAPDLTGGLPALETLRAALAEWLDAGADGAELWETLIPTVRAELEALKGADSAIRGIALRDVRRATGLRDEEITRGV